LEWSCWVFSVTHGLKRMKLRYRYDRLRKRKRTEHKPDTLLTMALKYARLYNAPLWRAKEGLGITVNGHEFIILDKPKYLYDSYGYVKYPYHGRIKYMGQKAAEKFGMCMKVCIDKYFEKRQ